ncbi:hypothetical protein KC949_02840 [Candidatus Saccharibacteria bacterium]|nr:hypothetical protein [Candidatus Saccharibacteria bacterium]
MARNDRGDTIIEVLFAITIFSLVSIGGLSLMNQGTAMAQRSLEIGLVREQIDAQADALRYLNHAYIADYGKNGRATEAWKQVIEENAIKSDSLQKYGDISDGAKCHYPGSDVFALDTTKLNFDATRGVDGGQTPILRGIQDALTYPMIRYDPRNDTQPPTPEGIWIQAVRWPDTTTDSEKDIKNDSAKRPGFYDFHIRACWLSPGLSTPLTMGTIVRLYEPRG